jgi:pSer/pThr/pTyr-binding forkhead associated (FHA) protein
LTSQPGLIAQGGPHDSHFYPLQTGETLIGRDDECTLQIGWDRSVSRRHARILQQSGLYWLEDLGSTNGTFLTSHGGEERQLQPNECALLLDGALIRLGKQVSFRASGLSASQDDAAQLLAARLEQVLSNLYAGLSYLPPEEREAQLAWLRDFEARLRSAGNSEEMLMIASEGTQTLFGTIRARLPQEESDGLPPLPEDLPDPASNPIRSILNFFIDDMTRHFPKENDQDG